jgi:3-phenylpropionate/trans-cinnamate dioxygenase ferredoxin reductase subunit
MALCKLAQFPNVTIIPIVSEPQMISEAIRIGGPLDYLPRLSPNDIVYAAGAPAMTASVARAAKSAGAKCHADPFVPQPKTQPFSADRLLGNLFKNVRQPISAEVG